MKFREFVGEKKAKEINNIVVVKEIVKKKEIIETNIGPTEKNFFEQVSMENNDQTYLGFGLSKRNIKRVFDYIKSWLIKYKVSFESVNPYLTVYLLANLPSKKSILIEDIENTKKITYEPKGTIKVINYDGMDRILLDYIPNDDYSYILENIFNSLNIYVIKKLCHIELFKIKSGIFTHKMYGDMMYSVPEIPFLKLGNVNLRRK